MMYQPTNIEPKTIIGWAESALASRCRPTQERRTPEPVDYFLHKGGWEQVLKLWLAVQFAGLPGNPRVECEQPIFQNNQQNVDILITPALGQRICIELKAESLFHSAMQGRQTVPHKFFDEVLDDINKLRTTRQEFANAMKMVIAVCFSNEAVSSMRQNTAGLHFDEDTLVLGDGVDAWPVVIFWRIV
jgi:hypothetical protein